MDRNGHFRELSDSVTSKLAPGGTQKQSEREREGGRQSGRDEGREGGRDPIPGTGRDEEAGEKEWAENRPVDVAFPTFGRRIGGSDGEQIERPPNADFAEVVRVAAPVAYQFCVRNERGREHFDTHARAHTHQLHRPVSMKPRS